ncbi:MAG: radical SAM protein, partial [Proteobacteria bacterium]|nr:radical SAM protein [Pseudomonadota bacterium]
MSITKSGQNLTCETPKMGSENRVRWQDCGRGDNQVGLEGITFSQETLDDAVRNNKLLNIQLAIPSGCLCDCIYCFQENDHQGKNINTNQIYELIDQSAKMGVIYLQILGKGEPTLNRDLLNIIKHANSKQIYVNFFTCGDVLGDDALCKKIHGMTGLELIDQLKKCDLSIFVKYEANGEIQDEIANREGYHELRDKALHRLIEAGFNDYQPTRLGLTPVILNKNFDQLRDIYKWGLEKNVYPHLCPLISTG